MRILKFQRVETCSRRPTLATQRVIPIPFQPQVAKESVTCFIGAKLKAQLQDASGGLGASVLAARIIRAHFARQGEGSVAA